MKSEEKAYARIWEMVVSLAEREKVVPLNERSDCWYYRVDSQWEIAVNGLDKEMPCPSMGDATIPAYHMLVHFSGWPFALMHPYQGTVGYGTLANIHTLEAALKRCLEMKP